MATTTTVGTSGTLSLDDLQTIVQQQEGIFGPLVGLEQERQHNVLTLEVGSTPLHRVALETYSGVTPPPKPGHVLVCTGECLILSQPAKVAAYRAMAPTA